MNTTRGACGAVGAQLRVAAEDHLADHVRLVLAHVRQQGAAVDVAEREQPVVAGHAQLVVDLDHLPGRQSDRLQADLVAVRTTPDGDEQLASAQRRAVLQLEADLAVAVARDAHGLDADVHPHSALEQRVGHLFAGEGLLA